MAEMKHLILIEAAPAAVFNALTTSEGLRGWWTADSQAEPRAGGKTELGFHDRSTVFRMKIAEFKPSRHLVWECVGDDEEWTGTRLIWDLHEEDGKTLLEFQHGNWKQQSRYFKTCNSTWGMLMYRLKDFVEGKSPGPYFTG